MEKVKFITRLWHTALCFAIAIAFMATTYLIYDAIKFPCARFKNISYGESSANVMDIYLPKKSEHKDSSGAILFLYETGWVGGDKSMEKDRAKEYASKGYVTASINVSPINNDTSIWTNIQEITKAIQKLKEFSNENEYNVTHLALHGMSSGAHLSMLYSYGFFDQSPIELSFLVNLSGATDFSSDTWNEWNYDETYGPFLACALNGVENLKDYENDGKLNFEDIPETLVEEAIKNVSPINYITSDSIPTICGYASDGKDGVVPTKNKELLFKVLEENGVKFNSFIFEKSSHILQSDKNIKEQLYEKVDEYCKTYFGY